MGVWETILHELNQSVQSGRVRGGVVGGGVMEDGRPRAPVTAARVIPSAAQRKAQSLPGYYARSQQPQSPQTQPSTFRDAFTANQGPPVQGIPPVTPPRGPTSPRVVPRVAQVTALPNKQQLQQQPQLVQWSHQQQQQQMQREHLQQQQALQKQQQQLQNKQVQHQTQQNTKKQPAVPPNATPPTEKKHKKGILGGIFRRRSKKEAQHGDSSSSSDAEDQTQKRSFLRRRSKRKSSKEPAPPPPPPPPKEVDLLPQPGNVRVTMDIDPNTPTSPLGKEINLMVSPDGKRMIRVSPSRTHSLGREGQQHTLGIPLLIPPPGQLGRHGVSVSHDSLPVSINNSSIASYGGSVYSLGMNMRSSSNETISKKDRREQLKARVEKLRDRIKGSSSDEEKVSISSHSMYGSESSLSNTNSLTKRSRAARTERFIRRKSQELETLRNETEKDKKTREAVQARIEEIQKIQKFEAERNIINAEKSLLIEEENKRLYGNNLYEDSSVSDSPRAYKTPPCRTPSYSPAASPHLKKRITNDTGQIPPKETVILRNKLNHPHQSVTVSLVPPTGTPLRRSFQDHELPFSNNLGGHRSASYDSSINRSSLGSSIQYGSSIVSPVTGVTVTQLNRSGMTPPPPPPRDPSRILSPGGVDSRPTSFSFENLNQDAQRPTSGLSNNRFFMKGSSPSPSIRSVPTYLGPKPIGHATEPLSPTVPQRRSLSEVQLTPQQYAQLQQQQQQFQQHAPPPRPVPPNISNGSNNYYTDQPPKPGPKPSKIQQIPIKQNLDSQQSYYIDQSPQYAKIVPISNIPPSPSSDYSSYMSDNSLKLQQVNNAWRQKDFKNKTQIPPHVLSDSSRSNSPSVGTTQGFATSPQNDTYGIIQPKKSKPPPLNLKQAESLSSLSGNSDAPSPVSKTTLDKSMDSDSSNGSLSKDKKNKPQNRPLSMVLEKSESVDKMSPPVTPRRPQHSRRNSPQITSASFETAKRQMQHIIKHNKECTEENLAQFEQMYKKERERLEKARCTNLEDGFIEFEDIYNSLKLDSDDLLDRAERRDLPTAHQLMRVNEVVYEKHNESNSETGETDSLNGNERRSRTPSQRRSGIPDIAMDDMHYRRCNQNNRNQPDVEKALQTTGSYLLASPALTTPYDLDMDIPKDPMLEDQPDIVYDDVSYRNVQRANSIKIIDPQPLFGIPIGPTTQGSESDYLHVTPKENYRPKMISRKTPDIAMDDLAYRNLRKDNKEVNVSELDEILSESHNSESPVHRRNHSRSASADRSRNSQNSTNNSVPSTPERGPIKVQTPRKVKQQDARRSGKFFDSYKDAFIGVESGPLSPRNNPSWLERAQLVDNKWDNMSSKSNSSSHTNISLSTSTETLTELSSLRAVSQPDIRHAVIREARVPIGGPLECELRNTTPQKGSTTLTPTSSFVPMASTPKVVNVQAIKSAPASPVSTQRKPYMPLDTIFNAKPKPFYLSDPRPEEKPTHKIVKPVPKPAQTPVDIAKLDALISSLSNLENNEDQSDISSANSLKLYRNNSNKSTIEKEYKKDKLNIENKSDPHTYEPQNSLVNELTIIEPENNESQKNMINTTIKSEAEEKGFAKANIQKAIRLSMALESSSSEGKQIHSRRRSAIDLPLKDIQSPTPLSPNTHSSDLSCLRVNPSSVRHVSALSSPPEQGTTVLETPPSFSTVATTCIDRIESMLVVSEDVHDRIKRAQSVPASSGQDENDKCTSKVFNIKAGWYVSNNNNNYIDNKKEVSHNINNNKYSTLPSTICKVKVDNIEVVKSLPSDSIEQKQDLLNHNDFKQFLHISEKEDVSSSEKQTNDYLTDKDIESFLNISHDRESSITPYKSAEEDISPVNETGLYTVYEVNNRSEEVEMFCNQSIASTITPEHFSSLPPPCITTPTITSLSQADVSLNLRHVDSSSSSHDDVTLTPQMMNDAHGIRISSRMSNSTVISSEGEDTENIYPSERPPSPSRSPPSSADVPSRASSFGSGSGSCASGEGRMCVATDAGSSSQECVWGHSALASCYLLACFVQLAGVDWLAILGLILAIASVCLAFVT